MRVIFLDDSSSRQCVMKSMLPCIVQTETADETIEEIQKNPTVDYLFLDHDLGGQVYVDSNEHNTGMTVAKWIVEHKEEVDIGYVIVHSFNPAGAMNMYNELKRDFEVDICKFKSFEFVVFVNSLEERRAKEND